MAEKFEKCDHQPTIHLDSDGTEIDDEEYFRTLDENTELVAVFPGEHWVDVSTTCWQVVIKLHVLIEYTIYKVYIYLIS